MPWLRVAREYGFLTEVTEVAVDATAAEDGEAVEPQTPTTPRTPRSANIFRVFLKQTSGEWLLPAVDPRVALCLTHLTDQMPDWAEAHAIMEDGASVEFATR